MHRDVSFKSLGLSCHGWFYPPPGAGPAAGIVMSHGVSATKAHGLVTFAEAFQRAGFAVLVFDYRHLGASEGAERGRIIPQEQHDDLRAALGWIAAQPEVDADRIGLWGSSYSGGHAPFVGAHDPRVRCIVAQVPALNILRSLHALVGDAGLRGYQELLIQDFQARTGGAPSGRIAVVAPTAEPCVLATPDAYEWFTRARESAPDWVKTTTLESVARMLEYQPGAFIDLIAPRPLCLIAGVHDSLIPFDQVQEAFARAAEPKRLVAVECGHFDFFPGGAHHQRALDEATDWFMRGLNP